MVQVWFLASAWKRARTGKIWSRFRSAPADGPARGDLTRLLALKPVFALADQSSAILILCDRVPPDLALFRAHFVHATVCLVTENPNLASEAPAGVTVARGRIGDRRWLSALAAFHGPNLVVDQRQCGQDARLRALAILHRHLARGGVYALRARTRTLGVADLPNHALDSRAFDRRAAQAGFLSPAPERGTGFLLLRKPAIASLPIRVEPAAAIPAPPAMRIDAQPYRRPTVEIIGAPDWINQAVAFHTARTVVPREARIYRFREAVVFGHGIVQVGGTIVDESLINRDRTAFFGALALRSDGSGEVHHTLPHARRIAGRTVHLWQMWAENYGHWLIECLPRLHLAARAGLLDGAKVTVQATPTMEALYRDSLASLGIGADRIVWLNHREVVFEELVYPTPITRQPIEKSPLVIEAAVAFRDRVGPPAEPLSERIYVSRNRSGRRRLANEEAVIALLAGRGYHVVHPETESFARQVQIFAAARFVVGGMGAAFSNLAFAPDGVRCLMLTNQDMLDDFFLDLVGLKQGHYVSLHGTSLSPQDGMHSDYSIPIETLRDALDRHGF